jgi:hypothetical protein
MTVSTEPVEIAGVSEPIGIKLMGLPTDVEFSVISEQHRATVSPVVSGVATVSTPSPVLSFPTASVEATKPTGLISSVVVIVVTTKSKQTC